MAHISFNRARAEGTLRPRRNASAKSLQPQPGYPEARRNFVSAALETALIAVFKHAFETRKHEEGLSQAKIGRRCGRRQSGVSRALQGRDWRLSTLSDFAEALDLRLEISFIDLKQPRRRFTPAGVEYAESKSIEDKPAS